MEYSIGFQPLIPWPAIVAAAIVALILAAATLYVGTRGAWLRIAALSLLAFSLTGPSLVREEREALKTIVALVTDDSESQSVADRRQQTAAAKAILTERLGDMAEFELRQVDVGPAYEGGDTDVSTALVTALQGALEDVPPARIGGAIMLTDGQVHDADEGAAALLGGDYPIHALITGEADEFDRRIIIDQAPRFGIVGEDQEIIYRVEDNGEGRQPGAEVIVSVTIDGELVAEEFAITGETSSFFFEIPNAGRVIVEMFVEPLDGELTDVNNRAFAQLDGIRENLRVLLVSGEPHAGERTWRNLLTSDASVDLVHFTILRPPQKQDGTPIEELSLIAFPTRELFVEKIEEFDLIIFDRYQRRGVLPGLYFTYMADYVRNGGAMLLATGPEFAGLRSIAATSLDEILPTLPNGEISNEPYRATVTETGQRHPVTRQLDGANTANEEPEWGRWFRRIDAGPVEGDTLLSDGSDAPVLALRRVGEGRVGLFLSDHPWLWAREFDGGGPHVQLLRRVSHWLMQEPELDEEALTAQVDGSRLTVTRQTMGDEPGEVSFIRPDGTSDTMSVTREDPGRWTATIERPALGLWQFANGQLRALAHAGPVNAREFTDILSSEAIVKPLVQSRDGAVKRLSSGAAIDVPRIVPVRAGTRTSGNGWIGLERTDETRLVGLAQLPLFAGFLGLALVLAMLSAVWYREGR
ncbi:MAG: hypothetical protein AAF141_00985 [Pseudomonadota bacterium]